MIIPTKFVMDRKIDFNLTDTAGKNINGSISKKEFQEMFGDYIDIDEWRNNVGLDDSVFYTMAGNDNAISWDKANDFAMANTATDTGHVPSLTNADFTVESVVKVYSKNRQDEQIEKYRAASAWSNM